MGADGNQELNLNIASGVVDWNKAIIAIPKIMEISAEQRARMPIQQLLNHPDSLAQTLTIMAMTNLQSQEITQNVPASPQKIEQSYLDGYENIPPVFDEDGSLNMRMWDATQIFGGNGSGSNQELTLKYNPQRKVFVKDIKSSGTVGSYALGEPDEKAVIAGGEFSDTIEKKILAGNIPNVIKLLGISGNKVAMPYIDRETMGHIGSSTAGMVIQKGETVVTMPLSSDQSITAADKYLHLLSDLYDLGYATPCQEVGDIEIRMNPSTGETCFYDFGLCHPIKPLGSASSEKIAYAQMSIDRAAYVELPKTLSNVLGISKDGSGLLPNSPIKSLDESSRIIELVNGMRTLEFERVGVGEKILRIKALTELLDGILPDQEKTMSSGDSSTTEMFMAEVKNSSSFGDMADEKLKQVFVHAIGRLENLPPEAKNDHNTVLAAQSLSAFLHSILVI